MKAFSLFEVLISILIAGVIAISVSKLLVSLHSKYDLGSQRFSTHISQANASSMIQNILEYSAPIIESSTSLGKIELYRLDKASIYGYGLEHQNIDLVDNTLLPTFAYMSKYKDGKIYDINTTILPNDLLCLKARDASHVARIDSINTNNISISPIDKSSIENASYIVLKIASISTLELRDNTLYLDNQAMFKNLKSANLNITNLKNYKLITLQICRDKCFSISGINTF